MSKRGRKKGASGEQSRKRLLEIAAEEFAENGYYATKISTIVARAGLSQPTFYLYFEGKEEVFTELVRWFRTELENLIANSRLESGLTHTLFPDRIKEKLTTIFWFFRENPHLTKIGLFVTAEADELKQQLSKQIATNLIAEQQDGYFRSDIDMEVVAESIMGIMERLTMTKLLHGLNTPEELTETIVNLLVYGLHCH
ncbi:TetR/AcrR family transcriptional regulator [Lentibacillus sp. N15]|uniref:TetR/AcrR family transcriptional regulator n=1 Tax=Lentibacillus songyuanensis TaxID=3136161 RepID=UPI0031B9E267